MKIKDIRPMTRKEKLSILKEVGCYVLTGVFFAGTIFMAHADLGDLPRFSNALLASISGVSSALFGTMGIFEHKERIIARNR